MRKRKETWANGMKLKWGAMGEMGIDLMKWGEMSEKWRIRVEWAKWANLRY